MKELIIIRLIGLYLVIEGAASFTWAYEPRLSFQLARLFRIIIGIYLFIQ